MSDFSEMVKAQLDAIQNASRTAYQAGFDAGFRAGVEEAKRIVAQNFPAGEKQSASRAS